MAKALQTGCVALYLARRDLAHPPDCRPTQWKTPYIPALLVVSVILFVAFSFWERHLEFGTDRAPLMHTAIWFKGRFAVVQLIGALGWSSFASYMFFASLAFQVCLPPWRPSRSSPLAPG